MLICVGSALIMELSVRVGAVAEVADPGRIAAQVVSGIGFIGAGSIIQSRGSVRGLTTAATIWVVAAIGLALGAGQYLAGVGSTVLVIVVLAGLGWVERRYLRPRHGQMITFETTPEFRFSTITELVGRLGYTVRSRRVTEYENRRKYQLKVSGPIDRIDALSSALMQRDDVVSVGH